MKFELEKVRKDEKEILKNLLEFYQYDFNIFYNDDLNEKGKFEFINTEKYFDDTENKALFVKVAGKYAGFALVSNNTLYTDKGKCIEEFWIMPKYRKGMFAIQVLKQLFKLTRGKIEFIVLKENKRWLETLNYLIEKNCNIEKKVDIKKWDEDFILYVLENKLRIEKC